MMLAVTHFDPVIGVDIHIIQPPPPAPPVPVPHPYIGLVFDVFDYLPIFGSTIKVNNLHRAIAGTEGKAIPPHIPIGGTFVPPFPRNEHENFMGSQTVGFDDDAATYLALPALSCQTMGIPSIPRRSKKNKPSLKSLVLPTSVVLSIPKGPPVFIGGPPTISLFALGGRLVMGLVGRALKWARHTKPGRALDDLFKRGASRAGKAWRNAFKNMPPGFLKCNVLRAEPVDIRTGEVVVDQEDFDLPGRIPIRWSRHYGSNSTRMGVCGLGWETPADARLELQPDGSVAFADGEGVGALFDALPTDGPVREPVDGWLLDRDGDHYTVRLKSGLTYAFLAPSRPWREVLVETLTDPCGNMLRYVRGPDGLEQVVEGAGRRLEIVSERGLVRRIVLHHPDFAEKRCLVRFDHDGAGRLTAVYDALGHPYTFGYGDAGPGHGRLIRHTSRTGLSFYYEYDEAGRCIHSWGDGGLYDYRFDYDAEGRWTNYVDSLGHPWSAELDARGQITREIDPLGGITSYVYDETGRTTAVTDPAGYATQYRYDERGNLIELIRADGTNITVTFDEFDCLTRIIDPNGSIWEQRWDHRGLLVERRSPLGAVTNYNYDKGGQLTGFTNPRGAVTRFDVNGFGNIVGLVDALGNVTRLEPDALSNVIARTDALHRTTACTYDAKGRLIRITYPSGIMVEYGYDPDDRLVRHVDENGAVTQFEYFGLGELQRRLLPDGFHVDYLYDREENLVGVINQRGEIYRIERDELGRTKKEIDYWQQERRYVYDEAGRLKTSIDPLGRSTAYLYDPVGNVRRKMSQNPENNGGLFVELFDFDPAGNLIRISNRHLTIIRRFDGEGRLLEEVQGDFSIRNTYDENGNRIRRETSAGNRILYEYDAMDRTVSIKINNDSPVVLRRDPLGQIIEEEFSSVLGRHYGYGSEDEAVVTFQGLRFGHRWLFTTDFAYDPVDNLTQRIDSEYGADRYVHDPLGHILTHEATRGQVARFRYDPAGDRLATQLREVDSEELGPEGERSDLGRWRRVGASEGRVYGFDRAGNLVYRHDGQGTIRLLWNADQRLVVSQAGEGSTCYGYDPLGRRIFKEAAGERVSFGWDDSALAFESNRPFVPARDGAGGTSFVYGDHRASERRFTNVEYVYYQNTFVPFAMIEVSGETRRTFYYHNDPNGAPVRITDGNGMIVWSARYDSFGNVSDFPVHDLINPIRLQGQYYDQETGLHYNLNRYYDPHIAQFISQDPIGLVGSDNVYEYAPNTLSYFDPLGLKCTKVVRQGNRNILYVFDKFSRGSAESLELQNFVKAWNQEIGKAGGHMTRRQISDLHERYSKSWKSYERKRNPGLYRNKVVGHVPDASMGGPVAYGRAMPLRESVNSYLGGLTGGVPLGTVYHEVRLF